MFDSKRFVAFLIGVGMFVSMVFLTEYPPMELAGAVSLICGIYIGGETLRGSWGPAPTKNTTITTDSVTTDDNVTTAVNTVETKKT